MIALVIFTSSYNESQSQPKQRGGKKEMKGKGAECNPNKECDSTQKRICHPERNRMNAQKRDSLKNHFTTVVLPQLQTLKTEFDGKLSKTDLSSLNDLRTRAKALRDENMQKMKSFRSERGKIDQAQREEFKANREEHIAKMQAISNDLNAFVNNNKVLVEELNTSLTSMENQLPKNMKSIGKPHHKGNFHKGNKFCDSSNAKQQSELADNPRLRMFLLWDGGDAINELETPSIPDAPLLANKPNPFTESTTISIELAKAQNATIELYDNQGSLLEQIFKGKLEAGINEIKFEPSMVKSLMPGIIIYNVNLEDGKKMTGKMIYKK